MVTEVIAFVGWAVTGIGWYMSLRGQRKAFVYQAMNTARGEIVQAFRLRQDVVSKLSTTVLMTAVEHEHGLTAAWPEHRWQEQFHKYQAAAARDDLQWIFVLEQYEVLFPATARCRRQLVERFSQMTVDLNVFFVELLSPSGREKALNGATQLHRSLMNESALIADILVYIQNVTLGKVVGKRVPFRQPLDLTLPRIVMKRGNLEIVEHE